MSSQIILQIEPVFDFQVNSSLQLQEKNNKMKIIKKKSVRFSEMCKVILIPTRHEYSSAGIVLWWSKNDFITFRKKYLHNS